MNDHAISTFMKDEIKAFALQNALEHGGTPNMGPIIGKMMAAHPELRSDPKALSIQVSEVLQEIRSLNIEEMERLLEILGGAPDLRKRERNDPMVPLEDTDGEHIRMRFAPGPSGPLHIGHTRAAILNDEYCKRYNGQFLLRLEDTNPEKIDPEAYGMIPEDLDWLDVMVHETFIQSDRFEIYYEVIGQLIEKGVAYVCTMEAEKWRELKSRSIPCEEREQPTEVQMEKWDRMLEGCYDEGEASLVIKTDLDHKNPAVRDFVGIRIKHTPHPRTGDRYHLYPLYNLSVAIDDHLMGCTHILRGKDHLNNTLRQKFVFSHMGWKLPHFTHYGLVSIPDTLLKTSLIKEQISSGEFQGWDDIRLGTVRALSAKGILSDAIRKYWVDVGVKSVDISFSWETLESINRELIDPKCPRYFFVKDPIQMEIKTNEDIKGKAPLYPGRPELGMRDYHFTPLDGGVRVYLPREDIEVLKKGAMIRLKDLCNVELEDDDGSIGRIKKIDIKTLKARGGHIIHWVPDRSLECQISLSDGTKLNGLTETSTLNAAKDGAVVQFERVGYCKMRFDGTIKGNFTHL